MKSVQFLILLKVAIGIFAHQGSSTLDPPPQVDLVTESLLQESFSPRSSSFYNTQDISTTSTDRPFINPEHVAQDCTNWINPTEYSESPSAFTRLPAVISVSEIALNDSFNLAIVDKYGEQLACFKATANNLTTDVSLFIGKCDETEPIFCGMWPDLTKLQEKFWSCLAKPVLPVSDYFHIEISAKETSCDNESLMVNFSPNGEKEKAISVNVSPSAEFIYIFATTIKTGVNMVYFQNGYTASKCQTMDEPIEWNQAAYFLPSSETNVKIYISYCHFTEVVSYEEDSQKHHWHKLTFSEDPSLQSQKDIFFYRNVLVDDKIIGNVTTTTNYPPLLLRLMRVCPLRVAKVSMTNAIWTNKCEISHIMNETWVSNDNYNFTIFDTNQSVLCINRSSNTSELSEMIPYPAIDPDAAAQDCSSWTSHEVTGNISPPFVKIPSVISVANISVNDSFRLTITDKYGNHFACFEAIVHELEAQVSIFNGKCGESDPIMEDIWSQMILSEYFHIEIQKANISNDTLQTEVSFRPNGEPEKQISVNVHSSAEFVYIFGNNIKTGVNLVSYVDGLTVSKCETVTEVLK